MVLYPLGLPTTTSHPAWRPAGKTTQSHLVYRRTEDSLRLSNIRCVDLRAYLSTHDSDSLAVENCSVSKAVLGSKFIERSTCAPFPARLHGLISGGGL